MKEVITRFKNTINISRTSSDRDKSFQINIVHRIQIEKRVKYYNYVMKKIWKKKICGLPGEIFFLTPSETETICFPWPYNICKQQTVANTQITSSRFQGQHPISAGMKGLCPATKTEINGCWFWWYFEKF